MRKKILSSIIIILLIVVTFAIPTTNLKGDLFARINAHDVNTDFNGVTQSTYISYSEVRDKLNNQTQLQTLINGKTIMFNTAEELYYWSQEISYQSSVSKAIKNILASSNYTLGADIDFGIMKARRFMPIGYSFEKAGVLEELYFTGTFDGRGFEISELELEIYSNFSFTEDNKITVYSTYFSMFTYNNGTIKDLGLINPTIDLNNEHVTLRDFSYLVGFNGSTGIVQNSYVVDTRPYGQAGMRVSAMKTEVNTQKRAAGLVHTNEGTLENSFFSGISVINSEFMHIILEEPLYYFDDSNNIDNDVIYNETRYGNGVPIDLYQQPNNGTGNTENEIKKIGSAVNTLGAGWFYYNQEDGAGAFPKRFGLSVINNQYQITSARDFMTFSKLLTYKTGGINGLGYNEQTYYIANDINMDDVSISKYKMPENEFLGKLTGPSTQVQINNFIIENGLNIEDGYHLGLFYLLGGTVENIKFYNFKIVPTTKTNYTGQTFYVGTIASKLNGGTIKNVSLQSEIDFTTADFKIGSYVVGSVAGMANGIIEKVYIAESSKILFGNKSYTSTERLSPEFYLGGVVGKTDNNKLSLYNILNDGYIENINTSNLYVRNNQAATFYLGGIIGYANNTSTIRHNFGLITNRGDINVNSLTSSSNITTYLGGIIGLSSGNMYQFTNTYGSFVNEGEFYYENDKNKTLYVAGILNSSHNEAVEYVQIQNRNDLYNSQNNTTVSTLINHLSNTKLTVSQASSEGKIDYYVASTNGTQNQDAHGAIYTTNKNTELQLNYINIDSDVNVVYTNNSSVLNIAGVTLNENANYLNVTYGGTIQAEVTGNNTNVIWVAGITKQLSANRVMKNSMNEGKINAYAKTTNTINTTVKSLYVGGLVNINESGDLHTQTANMPVATKGIINSINKANMTSYFKNYKGIEGRINTFAGGIATINKGSIQDVVNLGNIRFSNNTSGTESQFVSISGSTDDAGKTVMYKSGVVIGGISSLVTAGTSRIYDSINNGNILAQSYYYARSGGILGIVSPFDVSAGDVYDYIENNTVENASHLKHSVISNGINYGNIYAITSVIGTYRTNTRSTSENLYTNTSGQDTWPTQQAPSVNMNTKYGSEDRIALHSAAGGIIGSGLSVLKRMINHGQVAATDAAGGIIGSIFVYSNQNWNSAGRGTTAVGVTMVNINTAINYGDVRAVRIHSSGTNNNYFNSVYNKEDENISEISNIFYPYNDNFITPTSTTNSLTNSVRLFPEHKRGIGGIIGRIQRGGNQNMITKYIGFSRGADLSSEEGSFDFIVNMNENVDLIGRLDQNYNFSLSGTAFQFYDAVYYSAKANDNTQAVFAGFYYIETRRVRNSNNYSYFIPNVTTNDFVRSGSNYTITATLAPRVYSNPSYADTYHQVGQRSTLIKEDLSYSATVTTRSFATRNFTLSNAFGGVLILRSGNMGTITRTFGGPHNTPYITETPSANSSEYVYHNDFVMRDDNTTLTTGEPITSYIYYAEKSLLANRFQTTRPNGMYVLSTTAGSTFGSVLPRNFNINKLSKIIENVPNNLDYENVNDIYLDFQNADFEQLLGVYKNELYQTKLNDKSALLEDDQYLAIKDNNIGTLYNDGSNAANINYQNKTITFEIDRLLLGNQTSLDFEIIKALLPANALIARGLKAGETTAQLQTLLENFRNNNPNAIVATGDLAPTLTISGQAANNVSYEVGKFTSYSEAAVLDNNFTGSSNYFTEYTVYIKVVQANQNNPPYLYQIRRDNGAFNTNFNNVTFTNNVTLRFRDQYNVLANGHIVDEFISLHYQEGSTLYEVDPSYYQITSVPKNGTTFDTTISFDERLRNGTYVVKYKTYEAQAESEQTIIYNLSRTHEVLEFKPFTNKTYDGQVADYAFGYELDFISNFQEITSQSTPVYLARYTYNIPFLENFSASSFFEIADIVVTDITGSASYKHYRVRFILKDGTEVVKEIKETELAPVYYKNNVGITFRQDNTLRPTVAESFVTREAEQTIFSLSYNMAESFYHEDNFVITYKDENNNITDVLVDSEGVYYNVTNNRLNIIFDSHLEPATYEVYIKYNRNGLIDAGNLIIEKYKGTSAYLNNIKFSEFVPGIEYPDIDAVTSDNSSIITDYELGVYSRGIDYHNSIDDNHKTYRIHGEVSGIPLNEYMPSLVEYLPLGAKVQRKYYVNGVAIWSNLVDQYSTEAEIRESLQADFTVDPKTGEAIFDNEGNILISYIEYRVVSEQDLINNQNNGVTYFISVRDITYSFLAVFTYMYYDGINYYPIDSVAKFDNSLLVLNIYNYNVKNNGVLLSDNTTVKQAFDEIVGIKSTITQFYYVVHNITNNQYVYGLGNNYSGFYHFFLDINREYFIKEGTTEGENLSMMSENIAGLEGYYYYINASPVTRTRYFTIIITDNLITKDTWGLTDYNNPANID